MKQIKRIGIIISIIFYIFACASCLLTFYSTGDYNDDYFYWPPEYDYPDDDTERPKPSDRPNRPPQERPNRPTERPNQPQNRPNRPPQERPNRPTERPNRPQERPNRPNDDYPYDYPYNNGKYSITYKLDGGTNDRSNPSSYTSRSETIKLADPSKDGYTFGGWYTDENFRNRIREIQSGEKGNLVLYAKWIAATTSYRVEHYQQNLYDDKYTLYQTESKTGKVDSKTAASARSFTGFTAQKINQEIISKQGNTVVKVYYDRKIIDITIDLDGGITRTTLYSGKISGKYGAPLYVEAPTRRGYTFSGWSPSMPSTFPANNTTYKAKWTSTSNNTTTTPTKPNRPQYPIFMNQD